MLGTPYPLSIFISVSKISNIKNNREAPMSFSCYMILVSFQFLLLNDYQMGMGKAVMELLTP